MNKWLSDGLLLLAATIWGFAFVAQRAGMEHVGPFTFGAVRFLLGGLCLLPVAGFLDRRIGHAPAGNPGRLASGSLAAGALLFAAVSLQQVGIVYTTAGNAGFITGLYVIIVPLMGLFVRRLPGAFTWIGAVAATAGTFLLSGQGRLSMGRGDLLVLASAFFWAAHVLVIDRLVRDLAPVRLASLQFLVCGVASLFPALLFETLSVARLSAAAGPLLYAGLLSVAVGYTLQVVAQRSAPPAHAVIILSMESVFAAVGGVLLLREPMGARGMAGCSLMLAGMLAAQVSRRSGKAAQRLPGAVNLESTVQRDFTG